MDIVRWLDARGGLARRADLLRAGFSRRTIDLAALGRPAKSWFASPNAPAALVRAAAEGGQLGCASAAQHHGLALLHRPARLHLAVTPGHHARRDPGVHWHWSAPILPSRAEGLIVSLPDLLAQVARCLPHDEALVVWESAIRRGLVALSEIRRIRWTSPAQRRLAAEASDLSDSLIETLAVDALRHAGILVRQQVQVLGHRVDAVVGDRLVLQFDGHEHHSSPAARSSDAAHDARLLLAGWTVLRFTYADVVHRRDQVVDRVRRAMAQGCHLAA